MSNSRVTYTGNGSTQNFSVTFPFISRSHVTVKINNIVALSPMEYTWVNDSTINFTPVPPVDCAIEIIRDTPKDTRLVDFQDGAVLTEAELDLAHLQHFYIAQEIIDDYAAILNGGKLRVAGVNGITFTDADEIIDNMVAEVLESELLATLSSAITDIDLNGGNVLGLDLRVATVEAAVDAIVDIDGTGIVTFIQNEQTARIAGDSAIVTDIALMGAANAGDTAFVFDTTTIKLDSDGGDTMSAKFSAIVSDIGDNEAAIISETATRVSEDAALAASITALTATVGTNTADILTEQSTRADADTAIASSATTLSSTVDDNTAAIAVEALSVDGLQAQYTVKVDVNGNVAGYGLAVDATTATPTSEFIVLADKFAVVHPAEGLGTPVVPFIVSGGIVAMQDVVIGGALIEDASIGTAKIVDLTADKITAGNISSALGLTTGGSVNLNGTGSNIRGGKSSYASTANGFWLGNDSGTYKFKVGNASNGIAWDGSTFTVTGDIIATGNIKANAITQQTFNRTSSNQSTSTSLKQFITSSSLVVPDIDGSGTTAVPLFVQFAAMTHADNSGAPGCTWQIRRTRVSGSGTASGTVYSQAISNGWNTSNWSYTVQDSVLPGTYTYQIWMSNTGGGAGRPVYDITITTSLFNK